MDRNKPKFEELDLNLLKVFESLYRVRNMSRVAEHLFLTPSAVSHAVKRLRESFDDPLFVRQGNRMQPTARCQDMAPELLESLEKLRGALQLDAQFSPLTTSSQFRMGIHEAQEPLVLPGVVNRVLRLAPGARLSSVSLPRQKLTRELTAGTIDVAIDIALPIKAPIRHRALLSAEFCVVMNPAHPLRHNLNEKAYRDAQHISVSTRTHGPTMEDMFLHQQGINRDLPIRCQSYTSAAMVAAHSDLLLTMPSILTAQLPCLDLAILPLPTYLPDIELHVYWHQERDNEPSLRWFLELVSESIEH